MAMLPMEKKGEIPPKELIVGSGSLGYNSTYKYYNAYFTHLNTFPHYDYMKVPTVTSNYSPTKWSKLVNGTWTAWANAKANTEYNISDAEAVRFIFYSTGGASGVTNVTLYNK